MSIFSPAGDVPAGASTGPATVLFEVDLVIEKVFVSDHGEAV